MKSHPFLNLSSQDRLWLMWLFIGLALTLTMIMQIVGAPLQTAVAPQGIVSFEFAGTLETAQDIIASWNTEAQLWAAFSLGLDFLYPVAYGMAISLACVVTAVGFQQRNHARGYQIGLILAWTTGFAALFDYIENIALIKLLFGSTTTWLAPLAGLMAAVKFALLILAILYVLAGTAVSIAKRNDKK